METAMFVSIFLDLACKGILDLFCLLNGDIS